MSTITGYTGSTPATASRCILHFILFISGSELQYVGTSGGFINKHSVDFEGHEAIKMICEQK